MREGPRAPAAATTATADDGSLTDLLRPVLAGRRNQLLAVSGWASAMGLAEAVVLVVVTRIAFALSQGDAGVDVGLGSASAHLPLAPALGLTALLVLLRGGFQILNGWQASSLVIDVLSQARHELSEAFLRTEWSRQSQEQGGRLQELLTTYVGRVSTVVDAVAKGLTSGFTLASLVLTAVAVSPVAAGCLLLALVVLAATLQPLRRTIRRTSRGAVDTNLEFATGISEVSSLGREIQVFGVEEPVAREVHRLIETNATAMKRQAFLSFMFTPLYASIVLLLLVGALAGIRAVGAGDLESLGAVVVVMVRSLAYAQLAQGVYGTLHGSAPYLTDLGAQLDAYRRDRVDRGRTPLHGVGAIEFRGVGFRYGPDAFALDDLAFTIEQGEAVGIVGPSGSGKSTLVQLLLRLRAPTEGTIRVGDTPLAEVSLDDWRSEVTFVPQESALIAGTIADNIAFFRPDIAQGDIERAARAAHVHDEVLGLPGGYDAVVGGADLHLSGGQRQRICIARALLTRPGLVVLDEPTSALDLRSEARIRRTLDDLRGEATVIIIAHRLSTLEACDRIMVLQDGRILGFDRPEVLAETSTFYREVLHLSGLGGPTADGPPT